MKRIKLSDDESYVNILKDRVNNFDSYNYIFKELDMIIDKLDNYIDYIVIDDSEIYIKIHIYLNDMYYFGFNYDFKNYPIISFSCKEMTLYDGDTIILIDDNLLINLYELEINNFERIV